jgi:hypothetical protein
MAAYTTSKGRLISNKRQRNPMGQSRKKKINHRHIEHRTQNEDNHTQKKTPKNKQNKAKNKKKNTKKTKTKHENTHTEQETEEMSI